MGEECKWIKTFNIGRGGEWTFTPEKKWMHVASSGPRLKLSKWKPRQHVVSCPSRQRSDLYLCSSQYTSDTSDVTRPDPGLYLSFQTKSARTAHLPCSLLHPSWQGTFQIGCGSITGNSDVTLHVLLWYWTYLYMGMAHFTSGADLSIKSNFLKYSELKNLLSYNKSAGKSTCP